MTLLSLLLFTPLAPAGDYLVLDGTPRKSDFAPAVERLAEHRKAEVVRFDPDSPEKLGAILKRKAPRYVALVMEPTAIDFSFQRSFLQQATELDEDPFVDLSYGYITGANGAEALALVEAGIEADGGDRDLAVAQVSGGVESSSKSERPFVLRGAQFPQSEWRVAGEEAFPGEGHDRDYVTELLPELEEFPALIFVGHGFPREVVGGPDFQDLRGLRLPGAVVLNVACYTGVTSAYYERDWEAGRMLRKEVPLEESFCLGVLRSGAAGYTGYLCPRPAGPELDCDLLDLMLGGMSLGDARRRDYDKTVLGFLGYGEERLRLEPIDEGSPLGRVNDAVREMMLEGATGGVVFGDPAVTLFEAEPKRHPIQVATRRSGGSLRIEMEAPANMLYLLCNDPTAKLGGSMAHKVAARVPLGKSRVQAVELEGARVGKTELQGGLVWAIDEDRGERFLQVKLLWPRSDARGDFTGTVVVRTKKKGKDEATWGRELPGPVAAAGVSPEPAMEEIAGRHKVSEEALQAALVASEAVLGNGSVPRAKALADLEEFGSEGFRATCVLIEAGKHHYRTIELLRTTYRKGDERHLIALAAIDLPDYGGWSVLEGLGVADSKKARTFLLKRLGSERDAGLFMSAAKGLGHLKEARAVEPIAEQLLEFESGWGGVEGHLVAVLGTIGGKQAVKSLEAYCLDDRAGAREAGLRELKSLDPKAAARVESELEEQ